jgi:hypothetical protein
MAIADSRKVMWIAVCAISTFGVVVGVDEGLEQVDRADADDGGGQLDLQHRGIHVAQPLGLVAVAFQVPCG